MEMHTLGRTGLHVSALALGTVELGLDYGIAAPGEYGRPDEAAAVRLVHAALDAGMNLVDTARAYGDSEAVLGRALLGRRAQVVLASKARTQDAGATLRGDALRRRMEEELAATLDALQTDYLDIWQIHNVDGALLDQAELVAGIFAEAQAAGKVRYTGGSFYGPDLPARALELDLFDVLQVTYSVLDQRIEEQVLPLARARNAGIIVRSVLLKGALTARADHLPDHLEPLRARSRRFRELVAAADLGLTPAQAALAFALAHPRIASVLVGVRTRQELDEDLQALVVTLPADLVASLRALRLDDPHLLNPGTWGIP